MKLNLFGLKFRVGLNNDTEMTQEEVQKFVAKEVEAFKKSFTFDKLFTTGQSLNIVNGGTSVTNPYASVATVYKAVKAICDNVGQAEQTLYKKLPNGKNGDAIDDPIFMDFINNPNECQSFTDFVQEWVGFFALHGEAFVYKQTNIGMITGTRNIPTKLENLNPAWMTHIVDEQTKEITGWRYKDGKVYTALEIIHTKDFNPYNRYRGLAPCQPIWDELQIDNATVQFNLSFFRNDGTPGFAIGTDQQLSEDQRKRIDEWWQKRHGGTKNAFKMAVFEKGLKPMTITPTHKDMDFVSQKDLMRKEILGIWRVPECLFNMTQDINYATFMGQMRVFWIYTLIPILNKFSSSMTKHLIQPYRPDAKFDFDFSNVAAFQEQLGELLIVAKDMFALGYTADEINEKLQLGMPIDKAWRKEGWVAWNVQTAQNAIDNPRVNEVVNDPSGDLPGDKPQATPAKSMDATKVLKRKMIIKNFNRRQMHVEKLFESKMSRYFNDLRVMALKTPDIRLEQGIVDIDWHKADLHLEKLIKPVMWLAIQAGVSMGKDTVSPKKGIEEDKITQSLQSYLSTKINKLQDLNDTVKDQLSDVLKQGILEGTGQATTRDALLENLTESMRGVFKKALTRASLIARTETVGAVNGGSLLYYAGIGVNKKSWITAHDDLVRDSHQECEDQGDIGITETFSNGLNYPGDQNGDCSEVANCRCILSPSSED